MKGRGFGSFEKGGGGGRGGVQISALSGLVPLEEEAVRGACGVSSAQGSENLPTVPACPSPGPLNPRPGDLGS